MAFEELLAHVLLVASLGLAVWLCLPELLFLLGLSRIQWGITGGPEEIPAGPWRGVPEQLLVELQALGFVPLGVCSEKLPAHKTFVSYVYAAPNGDCFCTVNHLFVNDAPRASFLTTFRTGAVVFTQNYTGGREANEETFRAGPPKDADAPRPPMEEEPAKSRAWQWTASLGLASLAGVLCHAKSIDDGLVWALLLVPIAFVWMGKKQPACKPRPQADVPVDARLPLNGVLEEHRRRVRQFSLASHIPMPCLTLDDRILAKDVYYAHPSTMRSLRGTLLFLWLVKLGFLVALPVLLAVNLGAEHVAIWAVLLGECLLALLMRHFGYPVLVALDRMVRKGEAESEASPHY
jgi:hypothetical protein